MFPGLRARNSTRAAFVANPACFASFAAMRALRQWAALTYRDLEARAQERGERLPRNVIPGIMARGGLPRESTLACFVRACVGEEDAVEVWLAARRRIAAATGAAQSLA